MKHRVVLKARQIRQFNAFLRNCANATESENHADFLTFYIIRAEKGKVGQLVMKG